MAFKDSERYMRSGSPSNCFTSRGVELKYFIVLGRISHAPRSIQTSCSYLGCHRKVYTSLKILK